MKIKTGIAVKRPIEIHFFHWGEYTERETEEVSKWCESLGEDPSKHFVFNQNTFKVKTLEGNSYDVPNDYYIIMGVNKEFYPCEGEIFRKTYNIL